jgi:hypothetical protein
LITNPAGRILDVGCDIGEARADGFVGPRGDGEGSVELVGVDLLVHMEVSRKRGELGSELYM